MLGITWKQLVGNVGWVILCTPAVVMAENLTVLAPAPQAAELPQLARDAAKQFRPIPAQQVAAARAELDAALLDLDNLFARSLPERNAGWRKFLRWDDLREQLARKEGLDPKATETILEKYSANEVGLETPRFARVRHALRNFLHLSTVSSDAKISETYAAQLEQLATHLESYNTTRSGDDALAIGRISGWLRRARQADHLVAAIEKNYWHPNLYASVSEKLMGAAVEENIDQTLPVEDHILGTAIFGTAHTTGKTSLQLVPDSAQARFQVLLTGKAVSNNIGYNGPVTIYSSGVTSINGTKTLFMSSAGMTSHPATACCETNSSINGICAKRKIIEKIAWKKAGKSQGQAEAIASDHAADRVSAQMDERSATLIADTNREFNDKLRNPLLRRDGFPRKLAFQSQADRLEVVSLQVTETQLGAPEAPPAPSGNYDLTVRAHESSITNAGEIVLGGTTLTDERLEKIIRDDLKGEVPEELKVTQDKDPWSITFTTETPVRATFGEGSVQIAIRGRRFTRGDQKISEPIEISAAYTIEKTPTGTKLTRQGGVNVKFLERERLGAPQIAFKTFITRKFEALFKPEFVGEGVSLKGRLAKIGKLQVQDVSTGKGWISIGWNMVPSSAPTVAAN